MHKIYALFCRNYIDTITCDRTEKNILPINLFKFNIYFGEEKTKEEKDDKVGLLFMSCKEL